MDAEKWHPQLATGHWFSHLPVAFQNSLLAQARLRQLTAGQYLFKRGDPPCGLYAVLDGSLRISAVNEHGKEAILSLVELPYWFGEICLFDGLPRTHDACAVGSCTLLQVPQQALLSILDETPQYWRDLALLMSQKLRLSFINIEQLSLMPASVRLAHRLLMIVEGYGDIEHSRRVLQLPQEDLAAMLSLSRQTANALLKDLQAQGVVRLGYGEIEILDIQRLREAAHT
ncbi:Crp/Fnr family transcriptional regulator [Pseudomonas costantinii]|uniref:Crp/Fnr family transcriptional regulator n=1 Tax=Pseudomonas costantinii TaxID=168469 RepID=A0A1S2V7Q5_9PSED|nr:Crp/Fnr family transcriptional regulator [Pseudomonas costantinii]NVZ20944.1 Crp/Fnr family transcriptional regulator [Pseudomonas costantinii]OIN54440.1 Crp/Fnr family transcriptional regulator [Pseudomonas costantinii]OIN54931.1 Crp/Fnr family transcriptional regulator [Pseudomonas costantinii]OIN55143.1 Crp/Fnr family transcriptional regulator [Pseudomonas costantinii]SEE04269.1 cAMP-binding domain of CRP or a regulatory subunit of cAMP-dependent protein kinases [Pseudomonas costantinii]